jgi:hypothetical protein
MLMAKRRIVLSAEEVREGERFPPRFFPDDSGFESLAAGGGASKPGTGERVSGTPNPGTRTDASPSDPTEGFGSPFNSPLASAGFGFAGFGFAGATGFERDESIDRVNLAKGSGFLGSSPLRRAARAT